MNLFEIKTRRKTMTRKRLAAFVEEVRKLGSTYGLDVELRVPQHGGSRAERLDAEVATLEDVAGNVEALKDELQEWHDNLPENFQGGDKGQALEDAIFTLETVVENVNEAVGNAESVEFPGMY